MSLEECFSRAEYLLQEAEQVPLRTGKKLSVASKWRSLKRKIKDSYAEALTQTSHKKLRKSSGILQKLAIKSSHTRIVVSLFPLNDGYSITLMKADGSCAECLHMPYEEKEILDYIDNEELPPLLVDTLHRGHSNAFQCGCVFAEIRDYRIAADQFSYETRHVILKPSQQTLNMDVNIIAEETSGQYKWGVADKLNLESYLTLATAEPLCLDTSPTVAIVKNKLQARSRVFHTRPFKKLIRKQSALAHKRKEARKMQRAPAALRLHDFLLKRKKQKEENSISPDVKLPKNVVDVWRKTPLELDPPTDIIPIERFAKSFSLPTDRPEDIIEVQSILLESEGANRDVCSRITIGQRPKDMHYFGALQSNKYFKQNVMDRRESQSIFSLGTENRANLYILQYQELFTEDGRRPAKVTVMHANQPPMVYHIPNQQQPWQLSQEKSAYSVGSVINIPESKWKKMNGNVRADATVNHRPGQESNQPAPKQIQKAPPQKVTVAQVLSTPTLNSIALQNTSQNAFNFTGNVQTTHRRLSKVRSGNSVEGNVTQVSQIRRASDTNPQQTRIGNITTQIRETGPKLSPKTSLPEGATQSYTLNSSALASALNQMGGSVSLQVPVMTVNSQQGVNNSNQVAQQLQGQQKATVLRMPVGIAASGAGTGQLTAALNLIGGQNVFTPNVLGNIQLTTAGGITIPASQLPANIAMQLTSVANTNQQQQISLVTAAPSNISAQPQISIVGQSGSTTPFAIVANNDNWQVQDQQQTYSLSPRTQILTTTGRQLTSQSPQVQVVQQLRFPSHLLNSIVTSKEQVTVEQLIAATQKHNKKRKSTQD